VVVALAAAVAKPKNAAEAKARARFGRAPFFVTGAGYASRFQKKVVAQNPPSGQSA
jgi:hypothetical protein